MKAIASRNPLTKIHGILRARWYYSASFYLLKTKIDKRWPQTLHILMCFWHQIDRRQNNENADQCLFISLAQTLLCNRFWRYTCVVSAEVITLWTILQGKGSPLNYTLDKFRARKSILWTVLLARFVWVCLKYNHKRYWLSLFGQDGWILAQFFCCVFMDLDFVSVPRDAEIKRS